MKPALSQLRLPAIDVLRGLVIALMALDHVRDFFSPTVFNPMDLALTTPGWFWTRWITNLCAPTFVLLAGISAYLRAQKYTRPQMARYLLSRGTMLVLLEMTWITFSWQFAFHSIFFQVIWALGVSMMALAALMYLPASLLALIAAGLILPHNLLYAYHSEQASIAFKIWHQGGWVPLGEHFGLFFLYPLMPWIGLMAAGYAIGPVFLKPMRSRQTFLWLSAAALMLLFLGLRWNNLYGDPDPWSMQEGGAMASLMSFMRLQKYPPSLLYLSATVSISLALLAALDRYLRHELPVLSLFGRHPLYFYCIHVALIHALGWLTMQVLYQQQPYWEQGVQKLPDTYQASLLLCYGAWIAVLAIMWGLTRYWDRYAKSGRISLSIVAAKPRSEMN